MCASIRTETVNAARRIIRRGIRKRRKSVAICSPIPIENSINVDSNDYFTTEDTIPNNDIKIKKAILSDGKDDLDGTLLTTTNIQNISSTTKNSHHLDDPSHMSVDANNDHQFTIKCEIDVEDNLAEVSTTDGLINIDDVRKHSLTNACKIMFFHGCFLIKYDTTFGSSCCSKIIESLNFSIV